MVSEHQDKRRVLSRRRSRGCRRALQGHIGRYMSELWKLISYEDLRVCEVAGDDNLPRVKLAVCVVYVAWWKKTCDNEDKDEPSPVNNGVVGDDLDVENELDKFAHIGRWRDDQRNPHFTRPPLPSGVVVVDGAGDTVRGTHLLCTLVSRSWVHRPVWMAGGKWMHYEWWVTLRWTYVYLAVLKCVATESVVVGNWCCSVSSGMMTR
eukprot:5352448-Amphidinium_carterae.1